MIPLVYTNNKTFKEILTTLPFAFDLTLFVINQYA